MVEEAASASEVSVTEVVQTPSEPVTEIVQTLEANQGSIEGTIESVVQGGTESTCNDANNNNVAESAVGEVLDEERELTIEFAEELTEKGFGFLKEEDFSEAVDCFSRALEIRVAHFGELAAECINAYYQYGLALLKKAQAEADPLGNMTKKEGEVQQESSNQNGSVKNTENGESLAASAVSSNPERQGSSSGQEGTGGQDQGEDGEDCHDEEQLSDADEDESDLDMAWKMLDIARAIADKHSAETMEHVDILSALAEVSLEREDIESSLSDYKKALSILEQLVELDSRHIAELNFRICICLEIGCQPKEAIPYCEKAIMICKARMERLTNEIKGASSSATSSTISEVDESIQQSSNMPGIDKSVSDKEAEIENLSGLAEDLEKKLEDLKQHAENPKSILAELLGLASAKVNGDDKVVAAGGEMSSSRIGTMNTGKDLESPTVSTAHTSAGGGGGASSVTNLGVVGRGVKRVNPTSAESSLSKKPAPKSLDKTDANSS